MAKIDELLRIVKDFNASDLHLAAGEQPMVRVNGQLSTARHKKLSSDNIKQLMYEILSDDQIRRFETQMDLDFAYSITNVARYRINLYHSQNGVGAAIRLIPEQVMDLGTLGFSEKISQLAQSKSGLFLVTGPTNSGKFTTLAAIVDFINTHTSKHVITLEDPIEYVHQCKNSLVTQRQIGLHSLSFTQALKAALREDPDVILVGEMRDVEIISLAVTAAELGLLVLGTLHTDTAAGTLNRIIDVFPNEQQQHIRIMLADSLIGIVSQQLIRRADGSGRIVAYELMIRNTSIANLIRESKVHQIPTAIQTGRNQGMRLLDNHLNALIESGLITAQEAVKVATDPGPFLNRVETTKKELIETI